MLHEKYLPVYDFNEKHGILIQQPPEKIYGYVDDLDFSESLAIRLLFFLRGMSRTMMNKQGFTHGKFVEIEQIVNREIIIGLIGQFWKPSGNLQNFKPHEFTAFNKTGFLKSTWNFELIPQGPATTLLTTETRIQCLGPEARKKFSRYWFFIQPFSGLIRKEILKAIKKKAEKISKQSH